MGFLDRIRDGLQAIKEFFLGPEEEVDIEEIIEAEIEAQEEEAIEAGIEYVLTIWRTSIAVKKIPYHSVKGDRHYYSAMLQAWSFDENKLDLQTLKDIFFRELGEWVGYSDKDEWWFGTVMNIEELAEITDLDEDEVALVAETWEFSIEERGKQVYERWGWL